MRATDETLPGSPATARYNLARKHQHRNNQLRPRSRNLCLSAQDVLDGTAISRTDRIPNRTCIMIALESLHRYRIYMAVGFTRNHAHAEALDNLVETFLEPHGLYHLHTCLLQTPKLTPYQP